MGTFSIRKGTETDVPQIAKLLVQSWQENYASFLPQKFLDKMNIARQIERHTKYMDGKATYFIVEMKHELVGFTSFGLNRDTQLAAKWELYTFYVEKNYHGKGIGKMLLNKVREEMPDIAKGLAVWVMKDNPFRPFYEKQGFMEKERLNFDFGGLEVAHMGYVKTT